MSITVPGSWLNINIGGFSEMLESSLKKMSEKLDKLPGRKQIPL